MLFGKGDIFGARNGAFLTAGRDSPTFRGFPTKVSGNGQGSLHLMVAKKKNYRKADIFGKRRDTEVYNSGR